MEFTCKCGHPVFVDTKGNTIVICPECHQTVTMMGDYGFGSITPCDIYVGDESVATIINAKKRGIGEYWLKSEKYNLNQKLSGGYADLSCYKEAAEYIKSLLNPQKN